MLFLILCASTLFIVQISSSAIPVWELLSREEKMSYLYSMFANQVEEFCEFSENKNCNHELLKYGLKQLKAMPENDLDDMDPYQRGANHIIWDSLMEGHAMMRTTSKTRVTTTPKPNSYEDDLSFGIDDLGSEGSASAKIENAYRVSPLKGFVYITPSPFVQNIHSGNPEYVKPHKGKLHNSVSLENILNVYPGNAYIDSYEQDIPLTGPMVVKVYPDGTPVLDGHRNIPQDEDLRQYKLSQVRLPRL